MQWLDRLAAEILAPVAVWVFASGLDDLFLDLAYLFLWIRSRLRPRRAASAAGASKAAAVASQASADASQPAHAEPSIAILVPCWQEAGVIEDMLDTNLTAIEYHNYEVWLGVYPNDPSTIERVVAAQDRFPRIRYVVCPKPGPTTKADCLNAIYDGLCGYEAATGRRYEIIVQHDAEDLVHPQALSEIRVHCQWFDMVQVPVFPLRTPLHWFTHGTYCDEFAEFHLKELHVRALLGGFVPSAGVGTAYRREALEKLSAAKGGRLFETESLTEDYVMGLELHRLGCSQTLLRAWTTRGANGSPKGTKGIWRGRTELVATRAYFPFRARAAIRQRTRWLTGNGLQSWARFGWQAGPRQRYWLWRDRKALAGSPASALANLLFCYGVARWLALRGSLSWTFEDWLGEHRLLVAILSANLAIVAWRQFVRAVCSFQVYGWMHALSVPLRAPWGNFINVCATVRALATFARSRALRRPLRWAKTEHDYPGRDSMAGGRRRLGQILVSMQAVSRAELERALEGRHTRERLGECLMRRGHISEEQLYQALALQSGLPFARLAPEAVDELAWRRLGAAACGAEVIPFAVKADQTLWIAVDTPPSKALRKKLAGACRLRLRFVMVTASNFDELRKRQQRLPVSIERQAARQPGRRVLRRRPVLPRIEVRVPIPRWLLVHRRLSVTLEYRRVR